MKIKNGLVFTPAHKMEQKDLCFENGRISETSLQGEYDATGCYVLPGFIDTHIHGAFGVSFYAPERHALAKEAPKSSPSDVKQVLDLLAMRGVTAILPTLGCASTEQYFADIKRLCDAHDERILGLHFEGPFVNPIRCGGLNPLHIKAPDIALYEALQKAAGGLIRTVSMAPELDGADQVARALSAMGISVSMAHSDATLEEAMRGVHNGFSRATHLFNAMRPFGHRDPGVIGCALTDPRVTCELICDLHHLSPEAIKLAVRAKGASLITMISDSIFLAGMPTGTYRLIGRELTLANGFALMPNGTITGSALTLADGAKNMFSLGFSPEEIAVMACVNPACVSRAEDRGELQVGFVADVVILDATFSVKDVFLGGKLLSR